MSTARQAHSKRTIRDLFGRSRTLTETGRSDRQTHIRGRRVLAAEAGWAGNSLHQGASTIRCIACTLQRPPAQAHFQKTSYWLPTTKSTSVTRSCSAGGDLMAKGGRRLYESSNTGQCHHQVPANKRPVAKRWESQPLPQMPAYSLKGSPTMPASPWSISGSGARECRTIHRTISPCLDPARMAHSSLGQLRPGFARHPGAGADYVWLTLTSGGPMFSTTTSAVVYPFSPAARRRSQVALEGKRLAEVTGSSGYDLEKRISAPARVASIGQPHWECANRARVQCKRLSQSARRIALDMNSATIARQRVPLSAGPTEAAVRVRTKHCTEK